MSEVKNDVKKEASSLAPIKAQDRIMGWGSNTMLWLGGCISIGTLTMGSAQLEKGLNLVHLFLAVFIGSMILIIGIAANDQFSYKTGAPYAIQLKSAFGTKGSSIPVLIRGLPAIVWYGFQYLGVLYCFPADTDSSVYQRIPRSKMGRKYRRRSYFHCHDLFVIYLYYPVRRRNRRQIDGSQRKMGNAVYRCGHCFLWQ